MDSDFKKLSRGWRGGILSLIRRRPHAYHVPPKVEVEYDLHGVGGVGEGGGLFNPQHPPPPTLVGEWNPPSPIPTHFF